MKQEKEAEEAKAKRADKGFFKSQLNSSASVSVSLNTSVSVCECICASVAHPLLLRTASVCLPK